MKDGDARVIALHKRHYSRREYKDGRDHKRIVGPGARMVLLSQDCRELFIWRKFIDASGQQGLNCSIFRNEGNRLSSEVILEAEELARQRWPTERFYTYVNSKRIKSSNAGCCFKKAGWKVCGTTKGGLVILEKSVT
ncbi:hypothetical protein ABFB09_09130 [Dehalogenimonas sp. THU2]